MKTMTIDEIIYDMKKWFVQYTIVDGFYEEHYSYENGNFYRAVEDFTDDYANDYTEIISEEDCRKALSEAQEKAQRIYAKTVFIINE